MKAEQFHLCFIMSHGRQPTPTTSVVGIGLAWLALRQHAFWRGIVGPLTLVVFWIFLSHT